MPICDAKPGSIFLRLAADSPTVLRRVPAVTEQAIVSRNEQPVLLATARHCARLPSQLRPAHRYRRQVVPIGRTRISDTAAPHFYTAGEPVTSVPAEGVFSAGMDPVKS